MDPTNLEEMLEFIRNILENMKIILDCFPNVPLSKKLPTSAFVWETPANQTPKPNASGTSTISDVLRRRQAPKVMSQTGDNARSERP